jgi:hypothetical protein
MKSVLVAVAAVVGATVLYAPSTHAAAAQRCGWGPHPARMTIAVLRMYGQRIGWKDCDLAMGPIWDPGYSARPGDGQTMVMDGHDVTPVPGYGAHGPFYRLYLLRPGDLAIITYKHVRYVYRFVTKPFAQRQCSSKQVNNQPARLNGEEMCLGNDKPIKNWKVESFYIRCCWPRYTREKFLYERAVLIRKTPV